MKIKFKNEEEMRFTLNQVRPTSVFSFKYVDKYGVNPTMVFYKTNDGFMRFSDGLVVRYRDYGDDLMVLFEPPHEEDFYNDPDDSEYCECVDEYNYFLDNLDDEEVQLYDAELLLKKI